MVKKLHPNIDLSSIDTSILNHSKLTRIKVRCGSDGYEWEPTIANLSQGYGFKR